MIKGQMGFVLGWVGGGLWVVAGIGEKSEGYHRR